MNDEISTLFPDNRQSGETTLRQAQLVMLRLLKVIDYICQKHGFRYWLCSGTLLGAMRHKGFIPWDDDLDICMLREDYEEFLKVAPEEFPDDMFLQTTQTDPCYDYIPLPCKVRDTKSLILSEGTAHEKYQQGLFVDIFPADRFHKKGLATACEKFAKRYFRVITKCIDMKLSKERSLRNRMISYFNPLFKGLALNYKKRIVKRIEKNKSLGTDCLIGHGMDTPWLRYFPYEEIFPLQKHTFEDSQFLIPNNPNAYLRQLYGPDYMTPPPPEKRVQKHSVLLKPIL